MDSDCSLSKKTSCSVTAQSWVSVAGKFDLRLEESLEAQVELLRSAGVFSEKDEAHIRDIQLSTSRNRFATSPEKLEKLRRLCQIYAVNLRPDPITSHRKFIGPFIVRSKVVLFRILEGLLGKTIKHQRDFNAEVVSLLTDLCNEAERPSGDVR